MEEDTTLTLLRTHLQATVPFMIYDFLTGRRDLIMPRPDLVDTLTRYGDHLLYRGSHTAEAVTALVESVATLAFCPGGVACFGLFFQVPPEQAGEVVPSLAELVSFAREVRSATSVKRGRPTVQVSIWDESGKDLVREEGIGGKDGL